MKNWFRKRQKGAATLIITVISLLIVTMIVLFQANYSIIRQKITSNHHRNQQAFAAAEAGLEFGISYLSTHRGTILANPISGYIVPYSDANTTNVILGNNTQYSIVYTNPIANNYNLITITATGKSDDNTATKVIQQKVHYQSTLITPPTSSLTAQGTVSLGGSVNIINTNTNSTIVSGGVTNMSGSATTTTTGGTSSSPAGANSGVNQNNTAVATPTPTEFFKSFFGVDSSVLKQNVGLFFENTGDTNYSSDLNGRQGVSIWIDQSGGIARLNGNVTIGSAANPVILIVNGNFVVAGTTDIYGVIYVMGGSFSKSTGGTLNVYGGVITSGNIAINGNATVTYDSSLLTTLQNTIGYFAKVPGSWKDF